MPKPKKDRELEAAEELLKRRKAREKFADFCLYIKPEEPPADHHELLCNHLDLVIKGVIRRLMIFMPPGCAKSTYSSKNFPPYYLGKFPKKAIISGSYDTELTTEFGRQVRNILNDKPYQRIFNTKLSEDSRAKGQWATEEGGTYYACGVGSAVTGRRGDLGLIDDPVKGQEEADSKAVRDKTWKWYRSDFFSRLKPGAAQIIIQTRWNEDDLSGRILSRNGQSTWDGKSGVYKGFDGQDWYVICLPAEAKEDDILGRKPGEWLWPDYYTPESWEEIKAVQTNEGTNWRVWNSLYQQDPQPDEGDFFKREWFEQSRYDLGVHPPVNKYGAGDYAVTPKAGDFTELGVGGFDTDLHLWLIDWWSGQVDKNIWIDAQIKLIRRHDILHWTSEVGVIRRATESTIEARKKEALRNGVGKNFAMHWLSHIGDKGANALAFQMMAMKGEVHIPRCQWGDELIDELVNFIPNANIRDNKVDVCGFFGRILDQVYGPHLLSKPKKEESKDPYGFDDEPEQSWKTM